MIDIAADLRACMDDGLGETFRSDAGAFVGQFQDGFQVASVGDFEVETSGPSIFTADVPQGLVKGSPIERANGEVWRVSRLEPDRMTGATRVVLRK